jgi:serine/threonine-protein kinase HipA
MDGSIDVFYDWSPGAQPRSLGTLRSRGGRGREIFEFSMSETALHDPALAKQMLDPRISLFPGPQFASATDEIFGVFKDSSPDRWGEMLIKRRFERDKRAGLIASNVRLGAADFLLGVHDAFRVGALRYKIAPDGPFLDNRIGSAAPPFVRLRELEAATRAIESDPHGSNPAIDEWLKLLLAPGASLGGARPKASVVDTGGNLWIAKFPSIRDRIDVGAWEFVVHTLAKRCGLRVPESDARTFASDHHTFMVRRFDRGPAGTRIHFASAMTLTGHVDGDDASSGASYLEIADIIGTQGANPTADLLELWSRIVFNIMVSNTDDHLRNHGFLLSPGSGWQLSEAYDMNPVPGASGLSLNIVGNDNALDLDLARSAAPYFRINNNQADAIIERFQLTISSWPEVASTIGISRDEQREMSDAFLVAMRR